MNKYYVYEWIRLDINEPYMSKGAEWLVENNYTKARIKSIIDNITVSIKKNKRYLGCKFELV